MTMWLNSNLKNNSVEISDTLLRYFAKGSMKLQMFFDKILCILLLRIISRPNEHFFLSFTVQNLLNLFSEISKRYDKVELLF